MRHLTFALALALLPFTGCGGRSAAMPAGTAPEVDGAPAGPAAPAIRSGDRPGDAGHADTLHAEGAARASISPAGMETATVLTEATATSPGPGGGESYSSPPSRTPSADALPPTIPPAGILPVEGCDQGTVLNIRDPGFSAGFAMPGPALIVRLAGPTGVLVSCHGPGSERVRLDGRPLPPGQGTLALDGSRLEAPVGCGIHVRPAEAPTGQVVPAPASNG